MKILKTLCLLAFAAVMPAMLTSCDDGEEPSSSASSSYSGPYFGLRDCGKVISSIVDEPSTWSLFFDYDGSGRVIKVEQGCYETVSYDYNSQTGEVVTKFDWKEKISFDADANGRFKSLTRENSWEKDAYEFKYNPDGNVISVVETNFEDLDGKWTNSWSGTFTFKWDRDLLTSVSWTTIDEDGSTSVAEMKITYSDVDNKYRTPLCGLTALMFGELLYPNELSIAPAKLPKKLEYYEPGEGEYEYACSYTLDDEGFIEKEYVGDDADRYVDFRYTYADKEF